MSIGTWVALAIVVIVVTGYFVVTQTKADIARRAQWGRPEQQEVGLLEALVILWREALSWFRRKPVRKHSAGYLGNDAVRVTTLQTVCGR